MTRLSLLAPAVVVSGCFGTMFHLERNAPAPASIREPPSADLGVGQRVRPEDPGERMVVVMPEATLGTALWEGEWTLASAAQVAGYFGERRGSHISDDFILGDRRIGPEWTVGGAIGCDLLPAGQADRRLTFTARYSEEGAGLEAGYAFEPGETVHSAILGLYLAGWSRFVYLRMLWGPERGLGFESGIAIDYALTWVWSR